ncbi:MAG: cardiolipin synthase [Nitrospirota bacterium]
MLIYIILAVVVAGTLLSCVFIIYEHNSPTATMAWLLAMILLPFVGLATYFIFGRHRLKMRIALLKAIREGVGDFKEKLDFERTFDAVLEKAGPKHEDLMLLAYRFPGPPPTMGNSVEVQKDAEESYPDMFEAIAGASEHINAMYYIIKPDDTGRRFRDALVERAKAGVEVRLLYDDIGSWSMKLDFFRPLIEAGGRVREYRPVHFSRFRSLYANFRNHRKILVVDGKTAYTGGINIGDEYLGMNPSFGHWHDTNVKVTGTAASHLQLIFTEDWYYVTGELLTAAYMKHYEFPRESGSIVQVVPSGPDRQRYQIAQLFFTAITSAKKKLFITTPYFVPDESVQTALIAASLRGVDVRLIVPKKCDSKIIKYASHSYYTDLLEAGCRIYEYTKGFIHSKTMSVDGELGIVGTANMDVRSFRLNFEICLVCYDSEVAGHLEEHFYEDIEDSEQVRLSRFVLRPRAEKFLENTARLMSAVL